MAGGQFFSQHQKGIIKRYYENKEDINSQKLGELVSDLYMETNPAKLKRKWESVQTALLNLKVSPPRVEKIVAERNLQALAKVVEELF
jgi:hypothetical protein